MVCTPSPGPRPAPRSTVSVPWVSGLVVAIDAGTTGVRALAVDESATVVDTAYRELTQHFPQPGWVEHDAEEIWSGVQAALGELGERLTRNGATVAAIGITNQRETAVAWDRRSGHTLHRAIVWQDRRTAGRCEELRDAGHLPLIRDRTGLVLDPYFSATKYEWLLGEGGLRAHSDSVQLALGTVDSWLLWRLTGGPSKGSFLTDVTNASRTLLFDIHERRWSEELCSLFHVPPHALAEVRPSSGRFGVVDQGVAASPLYAGAPVSGIAGDQQAALFGQACFHPGMAKVTYGTGSFVLVNTGDLPPPTVEGVVTTVAWDLGTLEGPDGGVAYALEGSTFVSGAAIQWLRDGLGIIERADQLGALAESVPDSGGVVVVPAFTGLGSPWWDPRARGIVTGISAGAGRAQLARAVVEAMACQVRDMVDVMSRAIGDRGSGVHTLRADGGASAMELLLQLQADLLDVPVARPRSVESTGLGAATLAGLAEGIWSSLSELSSLWQPGDRREPQSANTSDLMYAAWRRAVERSRGWASP